jgi:hypothetical protein
MHAVVKRKATQVQYFLRRLPPNCRTSSQDRMFTTVPEYLLFALHEYTGDDLEKR